MAERELQLELSEPARDMLVEKGWDPAMGARPLRRAIQRYIEDPLADFVLREELTPGATVVVDAPDENTEGDGMSLTVVKPKKPKKTPVGVGAAGAEGEAAPELSVPGETDGPAGFGSDAHEDGTDPAAAETAVPDETPDSPLPDAE